MKTTNEAIEKRDADLGQRKSPMESRQFKTWKKQIRNTISCRLFGPRKSSRILNIRAVQTQEFNLNFIGFLKYSRRR
jgi:hypothetical protein